MGDSRQDDRIHRAQVWWSCVVAVGLAVAAIFHWGAPRNALMEIDRTPAQAKLDPVRP